MVARLTVFVQVLMEPSMVSALDAIARRKRVSRSAVVRELVAEGLARKSAMIIGGGT